MDSLLFGVAQQRLLDLDVQSLTELVCRTASLRLAHERLQGREQRSVPREPDAIPAPKPLLVELGNFVQRHGDGSAELALSPDPHDNVILATVVAGAAEAIVSGDKADVWAFDSVENIPSSLPD
ncbi:MAG: hypothetical protein ABIP94_22835 [Planctomycetota bacterium]